jgi:type IV secretory pathway VirB3-like protein
MTLVVISIIYILVILLLIGIVLYFIGKRVKEKEDKFLEMFKEDVARKHLVDYKKYSRASTPRVPSIKKKK